ncbi:MAG: peptidoglycan D,D-transpeptidase FtsI family protein [Huintestinicola sp.]
MKTRLIVSAAAMGLVIILLIGRLFFINVNRDFYLQYDLSVPRKVKIVRSYGDILDRNGIPLVNRSEKYIAVIDPETVSRKAVEPHVIDREKYCRCIDGTALFLCEVDSPDLDGITVIPVCRRTDENSIADHIIGYTGEEGGVTGIEAACDDILRGERSSVTLSYSVDATGNLIEGGGIGMQYEISPECGVMLSIDAEIQTAAENAMKDVERGAVVVMDISTGDLAAVVSRPAFSISDPSASLDAPDAPFINRAFSAYSVGSVFKLAIAGAALESGISEEYSYNCTGSMKIRMNEFGCHRFGGHGELDMRQAMVESCNPYFISLGRNIPAEQLRGFAEQLGFGRSTELAEGITSAAGNLPSVSDLLVPEEKANFCFGQGKLTATPLQTTLMTAAIANGGEMPVPRLLLGENVSRSTWQNGDIPVPQFRRVMKRSTADKLKSFMISTAYKDNSVAIPDFTTIGGKTSTAQTWTYNEYGTENVNCWFTGFFPADKPRYAVTVVIEEGVSGNYTCGPVFKEIADSVTVRRYASQVIMS